MTRIVLSLAVLLQALPVQVDPGAAPPDSAPPQTVDVSEERASLDQEAEETLQALLNRMQGLEGVSVEVDAGLARLSGQVPSAEARERAVEVARQITGVAFVDNRIELSTSLSEQLAPAVRRLGGRLTDLLALLPAFAVALVAVVLGLLLARWLGGLEAPYAAFSDNPFAQNVLRQIVRATLVLGAVLVAVEVLDVTALVGAVVGTAGVAGLALGFAFKEIVENYLAGLLLSLRRPFEPNDAVALEGTTGKVVRLTSRETILMDMDGNHVRIPNATVFRSVMTNYTRNPRRRFAVRLTVAPAEDLSRVLELGLDVLRGMAGVIDDPPPTARVEEIGDSWVGLAWHGWVDQDRADFLKVRSEAVRLVLEGLTVAGVDMPPPEQRIRVVAEEGLEVRRTGDAEPLRERGAEAGTTAPPRRGPIGPQQDVSVDRTLDRQIEEDRRTSDDEDLLR